MNSISFNRLKKKSLILAYIICPYKFAETLQEINNKKLFKCIIKEDCVNIFEVKYILYWLNRKT